MKVLKFGGSSVANAEKISKVIDIIIDSEDNKHIVFSAMKGVTNTLIEAAKTAERGNRSYADFFNAVQRDTEQALNQLVQDKTLLQKTYDLLNGHFQELKDILHGVFLVKECSPRSMDFISGYGEILNCTVISAAMTQRGIKNRLVDSRKLIVTDDSHGSAQVSFKETYSRIHEALAGCGEKAVITGFIASSKNGVMTTLGRNGSDYTASIYAAALEASVCEIWTDVDGVLTADPRIVKNARVIPEISVEEAMEMSYFGAEVIHPSTLLPTIDREIPVVIRNTLNISAPGTVIKRKISPSGRAITGLASIDSVATVNIIGGGMVGIPGMASRIFSSLARNKVNIIMISQASSEHSICVVCRQSEAEKAVNGLKEDLEDVIRLNRIERIDYTPDLELIAVIGDNMKGQAGISGKLFSALGGADVNILAIAQGSTEKNISFVIHGRDRETALQSVHDCFLGEKR